MTRLRLVKGKQGFTKTLMTIFAILFIIFIFIIFIFLFKQSLKNKESKVVDAGFSSISTEMVLKTFLRTQVADVQAHPVLEGTPDVGEDITHANLVAWTCNNEKKNKDYVALREFMIAFFDKLYKDDWEVWIVYSNESVDKKGFGHKSYLNAAWTTLKNVAITGILATMPQPYNALSITFISTFREPGFGSQIIPCSQQGWFAKVMLYSNTKLLKVKRTLPFI
jgi:hypothetical protein